MIKTFQNPSKPPTNNPMNMQPTPPSSNFHNPKALIATPTTISDPTWYLDSGASHHFTPNSANLLTSSDYLSSDQVFIHNSTSIKIQQIGNSLLKSIDSNSVFNLHNLMHVPAVAKNLLSV